MPARSTLPTNIAAGGTGHISHTNSLHTLYNAGTGGSSLLVAASDAAQSIKDRADYLCDGTADEVEINAALSAGKAVMLSAGTFNLAAGQSIVDPGSVPIALVGSGWSTVLAVPNASNVYAIALSTTYKLSGYIGNLKIQCNGNNQSTGGGGINGTGCISWLFENLWINKPWHNGLYLHDDGLGGSGFGHHNTVTNCLFDQGEVSNGGDGRALRFDSSDENYIINCTFQDNGRIGAAEPNHIYDLCGLNIFQFNSFVGGRSGMKLQGADSIAVGNVFDGCKDHSIRVNGDRNQLVGNKVYHLGFTGTNLDGIWVDNVAHTQIVGNAFDTISSGAAAGGTARSAINMSSGTVGSSVVVGNKIMATGIAYGTAPIILPAGTGNLIRHNGGYVTEAKGTATVASGTTSIAVTHGLGGTPALSDIKVTPTNDPTAAPVRWWVSAVAATTFTITTNVNPGASGMTFAWQAIVL